MSVNVQHLLLVQGADARRRMDVEPGHQLRRHKRSDAIEGFETALGTEREVSGWFLLPEREGVGEDFGGEGRKGKGEKPLGDELRRN